MQNNFCAVTNDRSYIAPEAPTELEMPCGCWVNVTHAIEGVSKFDNVSACDECLKESDEIDDSLWRVKNVTR